MQNSKIILEYIEQAQISSEYRKELLTYFQLKQNRKLALRLIHNSTKKRKKDPNSIPAELLMTFCYYLGMHNRTEDCLLIWKVKNLDFDTYVGIDIQLLVFNGIENIFEYLRNQESEASRKALDYLEKSKNAGDLVHNESYSSKDHLPWYI